MNLKPGVIFSVRQGVANKPGILRKSGKFGFADHVFPMLQAFSFRFRIPGHFWCSWLSISTSKGISTHRCMTVAGVQKLSSAVMAIEKPNLRA